ncbi:solute carrier family 4 member 11-like isoform X2 [Styela clava]
MSLQTKGGGETPEGTDFTYVNPSFDQPNENDGETTIFGRDGAVTVTESPPITRNTNGIVAYRGQPPPRERCRTISENVDAFSDITADDEEELSPKPTRAAAMLEHLPRYSQLANNNHARRGTGGRRGSTWSIDYDEEDAHRELILKIRKNLPLKDFTEEIRANKDLAKFLVQPVVLLDLPDTKDKSDVSFGLETIIEKLMEKLQKDLDLDEKITGKAGKAFFTNHQPGNESLASVDQLRETIQGVKYVRDGTIYEETWITALCVLPMIKRSHVAIARLRHPLNLGNKCEEVSFVIAVVAPKKEKFTKNAVEVGRTFSSLMSNIYFRKSLSDASSEEEFKQVLKQQSENHIRDVRKSLSETFIEEEEESFENMGEYPFYHFGRGVLDDLKRRLPYYPSDFIDGIVGKYTLRKVIATTLFLYFACLLPDIAFGTVYEENTKGKIGVTACIMAQTFGGLVFSLFSGQPLLVLLTTAPLALYVKVIKMVSGVINVDFLALYAMVGLWNSFFIILQGCFHASKLMKYSTRSTEEIFAFFIALAFIADAVMATVGNHGRNYNFNETKYQVNETLQQSLPDSCLTEEYCTRPENFILFLFLMLGTLALGLIILRFEQSQFLSSTKREILADYALPISVIVFTLIGSIAFQEIDVARFNYFPESARIVLAPFHLLTVEAIFVAAGLGLSLSCLFFVDQNVSAALVNTPSNKLQKGNAYHWDLVLIALINAVLSIFNLPWLHAALPHSPLHVRALADVEQHVTTLGTVHDEIVKVRETRLTTLFSHILIGLSLLFVHILQYIPVPVLQGLFLYLGITSFGGNQLFDRLLLFFTEGSSYPPNHYVRKVPQKKLHLFTLCQMLQLVIVCFFGFAPQFYLKMIFPILILLLLPVRHKIMTRIIEPKYLAILDSNLSV